MLDRWLKHASLALVIFLLFCPSVAAAKPIHVWEKQELTFTATRDVANPYTDVTVWVDLNGPGFHKRVYGFWDGGRTYRVRLLATGPGKWTWRSGSTPVNIGLAGKSGSFTAIDWTEADKQANPLRRGMIQSTPNRHALQFPDGTPFFIVGDTWYAAGTNRFRWYDDDRQRAIGPDAGFKDYLRYRKAQGYNWISIIAARHVDCHSLPCTRQQHPIGIREICPLVFVIDALPCCAPEFIVLPAAIYPT